MSDRHLLGNNIEHFLNKHLDGRRLWLNIKRELALFYSDIALVMICLAVLLVLFLNISDPSSSYSIINFFAATLYPLAAILIASSVFKHARRSPDNFFYLTNPTTTAEKVVTAWFISFILFPLVFFALLMIASLLGSVRHLFNGNMDDYSLFLLSASYRDQYLVSMVNVVIYKELAIYYFIYKFISTAFFNAVYAYGSIVFGRRSLVKTFISLVVILFTVVLFALLVASLFFGSSRQASFNFNTFIGSYSTTTISLVAFVGLLPSLLLVAYFWFLCYLRLAESEV